MVSEIMLMKFSTMLDLVVFLPSSSTLLLSIFTTWNSIFIILHTLLHLDITKQFFHVDFTFMRKKFNLFTHFVSLWLDIRCLSNMRILKTLRTKPSEVLSTSSSVICPSTIFFHRSWSLFYYSTKTFLEIWFISWLLFMGITRLVAHYFLVILENFCLLLINSCFLSKC